MTSVREEAEAEAPDDVRATMAWLEQAGYALRTHGGPQQPFNNIALVYTGRCQIVITRDRNEWSLDIAPAPGERLYQYDLVLAAQDERDYGEVFPDDRFFWVRDSSSLPRPPWQLPEGVSWRETLPSAAEWVTGAGVTEALAWALQQRSAERRKAERRARRKSSPTTATND